MSSDIHSRTSEISAEYEGHTIKTGGMIFVSAPYTAGTDR